MTTASYTIVCGHCHSTYGVKDPHTLRPGTSSHCRSCEAGFVIVNGVALANQAAEPGLASHSLALRFSFHGDWTSLFGMRFVNLLFILMTGALYHFWARAKVRRYLYRHISCADDRFDYHGTGRQLLLGFAPTLLIVGGLSALLILALHVMTLSWWAQFMVMGLATFIAFVSILTTVLAARRYQMSQTTWRNIPFAFHARTWEFITLSLSGTFLTILSLGAYYPHYHTQRLRFLASHTSLGHARFRFDGSGWALTPLFITTMMLSTLIVALPVALANMGVTNQAAQWMGIDARWVWVGLGILAAMGIAQLWVNFLAAKQQFFWNHTVLAGARFRSTVCARDLRTLYIQNALLLIGTAAFAWPWVTIRTASYYLSNLTLRGTPDLRQIDQDLHARSTTSDEWAQFIHAGLDLD